MAIFKTLRRLDTRWKFAHSITRGSTHEHEHWEHCSCTQSLLKNRFRTTHFASCFSASRHPAGGKGLIPNATWYGGELRWNFCRPATTIHVGSHVGLLTLSKMFFLVNSVYTNNVPNVRVHSRHWWYYEQSFILCRVFLSFWKQRFWCYR